MDLNALVDLPLVEDTGEGVEPWKNTGEIVLNEEQAAAFDRILEWLKDPEDLELIVGGFAGTGKTTLIKKLIEHICWSIPYAVAAFTGKAVAVLRKKGVYQAQTLHSLLYKVRTVHGVAVFERLTWIIAQLIVVDEGSMLSQELYDAICSHNKKRLIFGDPGQLEPIGDNPNLMRRAHIVLEHIHRQAEGSPIIQLSLKVREGKRIRTGYWESEDGESTVLVTNDPADMEYESFDVSICAKNATRHRLNQQHRYERGWDEKLRAGESVICLQNVKDRGLYNGIILTATEVLREEIISKENVFVCNLRDDLGIEYIEVPISQRWFGETFSMQHANRNKRIVAFDYAYAITGHKSQGSEWENVAVYREYIPKWDMKRWDYTAITRASKHLTYLID